MDQTAITMLTERVASLEHERRRWRLGAIVLASVVILMLLTGGALQEERTGHLRADKLTVGELEAQRIVLRDKQGRQWFYLESRDGVPQMAFEGPSDDGGRGPYNILLVLNRGGVPYMTFTGKDGGQVMLGVNPAGEAHLSLSGKSGAMLMRMGEQAKPGEAGEGGPPRMTFIDEAGRARMRLGLKPDGSGGLDVLQGRITQPPQGRQEIPNH